MKFLYLTLFTVLCANLAGCANERLDPPMDNEYVTVTIKPPNELKPDIVIAEYRSNNCRDIYDFFGKKLVVKRGSHMTIKPVRVGQSDLFEARVPKDGGSFCQWRLDELSVGVVYKDPARFGRKVANVAGGLVSVKLIDDKIPIDRDTTETQEEDLKIRLEYYPWLSEGFSGGYKEQKIFLLGKRYLGAKYKAVHVRQVYFEPVLHADYMVRSVLPKAHKEDDCIAITYPDGSGDAGFCSYPDFRKLQVIRLKAEGK